MCQRCVLSFGCSGDIFSERDIPVDSFGKLQYGGPEGSKVKIKKKKKRRKNKEENDNNTQTEFHKQRNRTQGLASASIDL